MNTAEVLRRLTVLEQKIEKQDRRMNNQGDKIRSQDNKIRSQDNKIQSQDNKIRSQDNKIRELQGSLLHHNMTVIHRQNLVNLTQKKREPTVLDLKDREKGLQKLQEKTGWTERNATKRKEKLSQRLHAVPFSEYRKFREDTTRKLKRYVGDDKRYKHPLGYSLPSSPTRATHEARVEDARRVLETRQLAKAETARKRRRRRKK